MKRYGCSYLWNYGTGLHAMYIYDSADSVMKYLIRLGDSFHGIESISCKRFLSTYIAIRYMDDGYHVIARVWEK